jgi:hypothetical protein
VRFNSISKIVLALTMAWMTVGCRVGPRPTPVIGEAYVGPATLKIRGDIPLQSPTVATVTHGQKLEILQRRRRFLRVRTPSGAEGWTHERELLTADEMASLKDLAARAAKLPVQGQGTTYGDLNVHTLPSRQAPSFLRIKEKEKVDVVAHVIAPRVDLPRQPLIPPKPKKPKDLPKKSAKPPKYPPPPVPKPPGPPADWLELSKTDLAEEPPDPEEAEPEETPVPTEEWSLIRTPGGQSGWVLTRRLFMAIPDEVAQYAEGKRIVSYFSLGRVFDGDQRKEIWLWTTMGSGQQPYDFDSFRVFIWSLKRHRYETAYIERNIRGYAPVMLKDVDFAASGRRDDPATTKFPGFSICMDKADGQRVRREYALLGNIVRFAGERPCQLPPPVFDVASLTAKPGPPQTADAAATAPEPPKEGFIERLKKKFKSLTSRKSGK